MRGEERQQGKLFSYVSPEQRIPLKHPIRTIRHLVDRALVALSPRFDALYAVGGRPSIPPEQLLRALLLQVLFTVRSERQLMERIDYDMMFRWFVGLELDEPVWDVTVFTKNRDRLLAGDIAQGFFQAVLAEAERRHLLSPEHFTMAARWCERGPARRASSAVGAAGRPRATGTRGTRRWIFTVSGARMRPINRPPIQTRGRPRRGTGTRPSSPITAMC
jgi:transposase